MFVPVFLLNTTPALQTFLQAEASVHLRQRPGHSWCRQRVGRWGRGSADAAGGSCGTRGGVGRETARGPETGQCPQWTGTLILEALPGFQTPRAGQ